MMRNVESAPPAAPAGKSEVASMQSVGRSSGDVAMELSIQQADLAFAVARALGSVSNKTPLPLLSCLLLEADKPGMRVTGTDLDVTTSVVVPCAAKSPGKAAVSARHFNEVVRKMPKGTLSIAVRGG